MVSSNYLLAYWCNLSTKHYVSSFMNDGRLHYKEYTHVHTCIDAYTHTCIHTYVYTFIHTYMHAYTHTYTHIHTHLCAYILCLPWFEG